MAKKQKFYVVWEGHRPGVYASWADCQQQTSGYPGAKFKSFPTRAAAEQALAGEYAAYVSTGGTTRKTPTPRPLSDEQLREQGVNLESVAVDAACSGNPGVLEFQGVDLTTGGELFHQGPFPHGTVNIGEFLAIVDALRLLAEQGREIPIYSDSRIGIGWVGKGRCNTKLERTAINAPLFELIAEAEAWLADHPRHNPVLKWQTKQWGEIPADFGRK